MTGRDQHIGLGDLVVHPRTGRIGPATQVTRTHVYVRFVAGQKASYMDRRDVLSVQWENDWRDVLDDDANSAEYDDWTAAMYAAADTEGTGR